MDTRQVLSSGSTHLGDLVGHVFDILTIARPATPSAALNLSRTISKLSPFLGNMIEFNTVEFLNARPEYAPYGRWIRQDPGFPDTLFQGTVHPQPGFEIKAWFPLATEITARFRDSQSHFRDDQTSVCLLAWLPDNLLFGRPRILDVCVTSGKSVAEARDAHYHNPPDYLVLEPEDTTHRTPNLQQTNTNGFKFQGTDQDLVRAKQLVAGWGPDGTRYRTSRDYQDRIRLLFGQFPYRLDTNFAKLDRIVHPDIEHFKTRVMAYRLHGRTIAEWSNLLYKAPDTLKASALTSLLETR
ncbi:MAG: hypothetical protein F4X43_08615 [Acidobacteria bacterium]|nr:hypothetical protein [Acidobacteriota bacterium]MYI40131.1 hypothetical protein [Acidobacteriota bacterium]